MINFQEQDLLPYYIQSCESELFRHHPISNQTEKIYEEKSDSIDVSVSIRNDFSVVQVMKKKTNSRNPLKLMGFLKVDKIIQNFKQNLAKRAYVYDKQTKGIIQKFVLEKFLSKETQKFNKFVTEGTQKVAAFEQSSIFISFWEFISSLSLMSILWVTPFI